MSTPGKTPPRDPSRSASAAPASGPAAEPAAEPADETGPARADAAGSALNEGFQSGTSHLQDLHHTLSGQAFEAWRAIPGLGLPTRMVQGVHDAISHSLYAAARQSGGAMWTMADRANNLAAGAGQAPGALGDAMQSALHGAVADMGQAMAPQMALYPDGDASGTRALQAAELAAVRGKVVVFIHGLGCDERSWLLHPETWAKTPWAGQGDHYGALLHAEWGYTALYARYNSAVNIGECARQLDALLGQLSASGVTELLLVGHSMGGLVAREACERAAMAPSSWLDRVSLVVGIGSPQQGAPLHMLGQAMSDAMALGQGNAALTRWFANATGTAQPPREMPPLRWLTGTLADGEAGPLAPLMAQTLGDGLVTPPAPFGPKTAQHADNDVDHVELAGMGHMAMLNHPRVYGVLRRWLGAA
jgi:pimeloyl-ACP methyl ester carboxylesterase